MLVPYRTFRALKRKKQIMKAARAHFGARSKLWKPAKEYRRARVEIRLPRPARTKSATSAACGSRASTPGAHQHDMNYITFMNGLKLGRRRSERKILADLARARSRGVYRPRRQARSALNAA